jgi:Ca2+/Na+ antiporter
MSNLVYFLFFPIIFPFIAKIIWKHTINIKEMLLQIVILVLAVLFIYIAFYYGQTYDTEIWNGYIKSKERTHGQYTELYSCNCRTVGSGNNSRTECDTCSREHYTVSWDAYSTVGDIRFNHKDSLSRSVYSSADPESYINCVIGEPASLSHSYQNYIIASKNSLFNNTLEDIDFKGKIPNYPVVYDYYKINRVLNVDSKIPLSKVKELNFELNESLKQLGNQKQVNIIVILTEIDDTSYRYAVEDTWIGGKKNDVVIFIGLNENEITWADVMTFAKNIGNEELVVKLRDDIIHSQYFDTTKLHTIITDNIKKYYIRPTMKKFEYLKESIDIPFYAKIILIVLIIGGSIGLTIYFHINEV